MVEIRTFPMWPTLLRLFYGKVAESSEQGNSVVEAIEAPTALPAVTKEKKKRTPAQQAQFLRVQQKRLALLAAKKALPRTQQSASPTSKTSSEIVMAQRPPPVIQLAKSPTDMMDLYVLEKSKSEAALERVMQLSSELAATNARLEKYQRKRRPRYRHGGSSSSARYADVLSSDSSDEDDEPSQAREHRDREHLLRKARRVLDEEKEPKYTRYERILQEELDKAKKRAEMAEQQQQANGTQNNRAMVLQERQIQAPTTALMPADASTGQENINPADETGPIPIQYSSETLSKQLAWHRQNGLSPMSNPPTALQRRQQNNAVLGRVPGANSW